MRTMASWAVVLRGGCYRPHLYPLFPPESRDDKSELNLLGISQSVERFPGRIIRNPQWNNTKEAALAEAESHRNSWDFLKLEKKQKMENLNKLSSCPSTGARGLWPWDKMTTLRKASEGEPMTRMPLMAHDTTFWARHRSKRNDENLVSVWRPRGERFNPAFALQRLTTPTAGVIVWGAIP
ncbi:hypothetical protein TNCV_417611 [Trichonephila clavipes]|nr:hypothetical protein TNCV_417611 [Trichonephila clavipes]